MYRTITVVTNIAANEINQAEFDLLQFDLRYLLTRAYARGGLGLTPSFSLIFYEKFITCAKEINCFRILFTC